MKRLGPALTEAMREAAYAYAARLHRKGVDLELALAEAKRLASRNLLTLDGFKKPARRKKKAA